MNIKHNIPLIAGLTIPVLMIAFVAASIYLPGLYSKPSYNFVYSTGTYPVYCDQKTAPVYDKNIEGDYTRYTYAVTNGHLTQEIEEKVGRSNCYYDNNAPRFYVHDTDADTNRELTFDEAHNLSLSDNKTAPDGFEMVYGSRGDNGFPFFFDGGRDYETVYLKKGATSKKVSVKNNTSSYYRQINFIGWVN